MGYSSHADVIVGVVVPMSVFRSRFEQEHKVDPRVPLHEELLWWLDKLFEFRVQFTMLEPKFEGQEQARSFWDQDLAVHSEESVLQSEYWGHSFAVCGHNSKPVDLSVVAASVPKLDEFFAAFGLESALYTPQLILVHHNG